MMSETWVVVDLTLSYGFGCYGDSCSSCSPAHRMGISALKRILQHTSSSGPVFTSDILSASSALGLCVCVWGGEPTSAMSTRWVNGMQEEGCFHLYLTLVVLLCFSIFIPASSLQLHYILLPLSYHRLFVQSCCNTPPCALHWLHFTLKCWCGGCCEVITNRIKLWNL